MNEEKLRRLVGKIHRIKLAMENVGIEPEVVVGSEKLFVENGWICGLPVRVMATCPPNMIYLMTQEQYDDLMRELSQ